MIMLILVINQMKDMFLYAEDRLDYGKLVGIIQYFIIFHRRVDGITVLGRDKYQLLLTKVVQFISELCS